MKFWTKKTPLSLILCPFSLGYRIVVLLRRYLYGLSIFKIFYPSVPVITIGNITVGGTGKTPLVIFLANYLKTQGWHPGIVSRRFRPCLSRR